MSTQLKTQLKKQRHARVRAKLSGTNERPRLVVARSLQHIEAQLIDDNKGMTLAVVSDRNKKGSKIERAAQVGTDIAKISLKKDIKTVIFDRGARRYHGRVKALAEAARAAGLKF